MPRTEIEIVTRTVNEVGECPVWHMQEKALYWIDARSPKVFRIDSAGDAKSWSLPAPAGSFVFRSTGELIVAVKGCFAAVDLDRGTFVPIADLDADSVETKPNDGRCDRLGRYWCGTSDRGQAEPVGSLYCLDGDLSCRRMDTGIVAANCGAFSPDDRTMYYGDSRSDIVWAYDFDLADGVINNKRVFISTRHMPGRVDGAAVDAEGNYWGAMVHGGRIGCWNARGALVRTVDLPVRHPTMCCFGGEKLDVLYVTTASAMLLPDEGQDQPLAGCVLAVHGLGCVGQPAAFFAG